MLNHCWHSNESELKYLLYPRLPLKQNLIGQFDRLTQNQDTSTRIHNGLVSEDGAN